MLNSPEYPWREVRLGGAPMERDRWLSLHAGHDTYTGVLPAEPQALEFVACWRCGVLALGKVPPPPAPADTHEDDADISHREPKPKGKHAR